MVFQGNLDESTCRAKMHQTMMIFPNHNAESTTENFELALPDEISHEMTHSDEYRLTMTTLMK